MNKSKEVDLEKAFQQSGIPFQQWVSDYIKSRAKGWRVTKEEYPISVGEMQSRADLVAEASRYKLLIECKLSNPEYVTWHFSKTKREHFGDVLTYAVEKTSHNPDRKHNPASILRRKLDIYFELGRFQAVHCLELKKKQTNKLPFDTRTIQDAGHQVALSTFGILSERHEEITKSGTCQECYIPVIFTNAELHYACYEPLNEKKIEDFRDERSVIYHHGVSDHIWQQMKERFNGEDPNKRLSVFVVNFKAIDYFFGELNEYLGIGE